MSKDATLPKEQVDMNTERKYKHHIHH